MAGVGGMPSRALLFLMLWQRYVDAVVVVFAVVLCAKLMYVFYPGILVGWD